MLEINGRENIEKAVRGLLAIGIFNARSFDCALTPGEVRAVASELSTNPLADTVDGWTVVMSYDTLAARTLRRIAGALGVVPHHETLAGLVRMIDASSPDAVEFYEATPSVAALTTLLAHLDCVHDDEKADFSTLFDCIDPTDMELRILRLLEGTLDCNMTTAGLVRRLNMEGKRTTFNDRILPTVPFIAGGKTGETVRLLGQFPDPALHKHSFGPCNLGMSRSADATRLILEYRLTEEAVETASFNVKKECREAIHGSYHVESTGTAIRFNKDGKDARKLTGLRTVILREHREYANGQLCLVLLDKDAGTADVKVIDSTDHARRAEIMSWLDESYAPSMAA